MIAIVVSRADRASVHIGERLRETADWTAHEDPERPDADGGGTYYRTDGFEIREFDGLHVELDDPVPAFSEPPEFLVFVSRHSGETGPLLTGHFTGNFGPAEFGGEDATLAPAAPNALSVLVEAMAARAPEGYEVGIECTHHGPTGVSAPSLFAEVGSSEAEWEDPAGARAVAGAVLALNGVDARRDRQLVGLGGGHYAPRFTRVLRETPWAVGHVGSDWQLDELGSVDGSGRRVLEQAFERSGARHALLDGAPERVERAVEDLGYRVVGETWVREVGDRPLEAVESLEADLRPVEDGLRFGEHPPDGGYDVVDLPEDLLSAARGVDPVATREAVAARAVAFETEENGNVVVGRAALPGREVRDALVDALADVLDGSEKYESVDREPGAVVAREAAFDPSKARTLGVPDGPKFGRLADGEAVEVDGERVPPEAVRTERVHRFPV